MIPYALRAARSQDALNVTLFHEWVFPDGALWTRFFRIADGYLLRFPALADFTVSEDGLKIVAYPAPKISKETIEHLYLNQVLPLALSRQHKLVLHASAVEIKHSAIAFLGESGRGKSTLAASFSTGGSRFLTDDGLQLEKTINGYLVHPSHASIRLWDDSWQALTSKDTQLAPAVDFTPKARLLTGDDVVFCNVARPLRCAYFLGHKDAENISIQRVSGREAMIELVKNSFLLDVEEQGMLTVHFEQLTALADTVKCYLLDYPRRYDVLPKIREAILNHTQFAD